MWIAMCVYTTKKHLEEFFSCLWVIKLRAVHQGRNYTLQLSADALLAANPYCKKQSLI